MPRISLHWMLLLACALALAGCLSTGVAGDRYFDAGAYAKAAEEYRALLAGDALVRDRDRVLYQLAFSYFVRSSPAYDLEAAREWFTRLTRELPRSPYAPRARAMLESVEQTERLQARLELELRRSEELLALVERQRRYLEQANAAALESDGLTADLYHQLDQQKRRLQALNKELAANSHQIQQLTDELGKIKKMDLAPPP